MRPAMNGVNTSGQSLEKEKFDYLTNLNFKFMNYARSSLVAGEKVIFSLLQPEIKGRARVFLHAPIRPAHLTILTDMELILISDGDGIKKTNKYKHGGVWRYIPLRSIVAVSQEETTDGLITLSIHLPAGGLINKTFNSSKKNELEQLRQEIEALSG
jgi:hypothetical protein